MSFIEHTNYPQLKQDSPEEILHQMLLTINSHQQVARMELNKILLMDGKRYVRYDDVIPQVSSILQSNPKMISSKSLLSVINRFISGSFTPINQIKALILYLMTTGFIHDHIDEIKFNDYNGDPIKIDDAITLEGSIREYYKIHTDKYEELYMTISNKYPDLEKEFSIDRIYYVNTEASDILSSRKSAVGDRYTAEQISDIYYSYIIPLRESYKMIVSPPAVHLYPVLKIGKAAYKSNKETAFKTIENILPSGQYNSILARHLELNNISGDL